MKTKDYLCVNPMGAFECFVTLKQNNIISPQFQPLLSKPKGDLIGVRVPVNTAMKGTSYVPFPDNHSCFAVDRLPLLTKNVRPQIRYQGAVYRVTPVHIETIRPGDTIVDPYGVIRTVCGGNIDNSIDGTLTIFGDSYRLGTEPVYRIEF